MSLRYGRLFDATVRADYEKALTLAKTRLGPVLPGRTQLPIAEITGGTTDWQQTPLIKARVHHGVAVAVADDRGPVVRDVAVAVRVGVGAEDAGVG